MITVEKFREALAALWEVRYATASPENAIRDGKDVPVHVSVAFAALEKLLAAEPQPRELTDEELITEIDRLWGVRESFGPFFVENCRQLIRRAIEQSAPAMCGPTAFEVLMAYKRSCEAKLSDTDVPLFGDWYKANVKPIAEVTAPLEERIEELEADLHDALGTLKRAGWTRKKGAAWCPPVNKQAVHLLGAIRDLESQLAKSQKERSKLGLDLVEQVADVAIHQAKIEKLKAQFAAAKANKPPCCTKEEMRSVVVEYMLQVSLTVPKSGTCW